MKFVKQVYLLILLVSVSHFLSAQKSKYRYEFGINAGFAVYQGDLTPRRLGSFETQKFSLGFHGSRIMNAFLSVRGNLFIGKLRGDDAVYSEPEYRQQRNFNFISPVTELSAQLVLSPAGTNYRDKGFSPYLFAGAGLSLLRIQRDWSRINPSYFPEEGTIWTGLDADSAHAVPRLLPVLPVGAGIKYFFKPNWAINAETSYRVTATDYLDGFSQSANPERRDKYFNYSVGVVFRPGRLGNWKCPVIKY